MPYPNEHSLRMQDPDKFDSYDRTKGGKLFGGALVVPATISVIWGHPKGGPKAAAIPQALRFPTDDWTEAEAKKWIKDNTEHGAKGSFEPVTKEESLAAKVASVRALAEGGAGSGNFGHAGRPGEQGGSGSGGVVQSPYSKGTKAGRAAAIQRGEIDRLAMTPVGRKSYDAMTGRSREIGKIRKAAHDKYVSSLRRIWTPEKKKILAKQAKDLFTKANRMANRKGKLKTEMTLADKVARVRALAEITTSVAISARVAPQMKRKKIKTKMLQKRRLAGTEMVINFAEQFFSLQVALQRAVQSAFGAGAWVTDFSDSEVIFRPDPGPQSGGSQAPGPVAQPSDEFLKLSYIIRDYEIVLGDEEPESVMCTNMYEPITTEQMVQMADAQHCLKNIAAVDEVAWKVHATHDKKEPKHFAVSAKSSKHAWAKAKAACADSGHKVSSVKAEAIVDLAHLCQRQLKGTQTLFSLAEQFYSLAHEISLAVVQRFGEKSWVCDFSDSEVVFKVGSMTSSSPMSSDAENEYQVLGYEIVDGEVVLADGEPERVVRTVLYEPIDAQEMVKLTDVQNQLAEGGAGSGNFGHSGRPGEVGGSGEGGGSGEAKGKSSGRLTGDVSGLRGDVRDLRGNANGVRGDVTGLRGDVSGLGGDVSGLRGDVSGLRGNVTGLRGDIDRLKLTLEDRAGDGWIKKLLALIGKSEMTLADKVASVRAL